MHYEEELKLMWQRQQRSRGKKWKQEQQPTSCSYWVAYTSTLPEHVVRMLTSKP